NADFNLVSAGSQPRFTFVLQYSDYYSFNNVVVWDTLPNGLEYVEARVGNCNSTYASNPIVPTTGGSVFCRADGTSLVVWNLSSSAPTHVAPGSCTWLQMIVKVDTHYYCNNTGTALVNCGDNFLNISCQAGNYGSVAGLTPATPSTFFQDCGPNMQTGLAIPCDAPQKIVQSVHDAAGNLVPGNSFVTPGDIVTYRITVTASSGPMTGVSVSDTLPNGLSYSGGWTQAGNENAGSSGGAGQFRWWQSFTPDPFLQNNIWDVTFDALVNNDPVNFADPAGGCVINNMDYTGYNSTNVTVTGYATATVCYLDNLTVTKTNDHPVANTGDPVNYTITITNNGYRRIWNLEVFDTIPAGMDYVNGTTSPAPSTVTANGGGSVTLKWNSLGFLDPSQSMVLTATA